MHHYFLHYTIVDINVLQQVRTSLYILSSVAVLKMRQYYFYYLLYMDVLQVLVQCACVVRLKHGTIEISEGYNYRLVSLTRFVKVN